MQQQNTLILIVTFQGASTICQTIAACLSDSLPGQDILIIDNASSDGTPALVKSLSCPGMRILEMEKNIGVAAAYNIGLKKAREWGKKWLFILDQDSVCQSVCLNKLLHTAQFFQDKGEKIAAVCPTVKSSIFPHIIHFPYGWDGTVFFPITGNGTDQIRIDSTVSSGTLYSVNALVSVGGFREEYFIDFVDHDCHLRLREAGWIIMWEKKAEIYHNLGKIQRFTHEGLWIEHAPYRYYYMARNMADGFYRFGKSKAILHFASELMRHLLRLIKYGRNPYQSIYYIFRGVGDAIRKKFGKLDSDL